MSGFYQIILITLVSLFQMLFSFQVFSQNFEGEIVFSKETKVDTTYVKYKIKGNKVRVDELDKNQQLTNYLLVDISQNKVYTLNPKRKLYVESHNYRGRRDNDTAGFVVYKTENYKSIKGYKCYQWRVRNKKEDTEIAFWVNNELFADFYDLLKLINHGDKNSIYYLQIPDSKGFFPLLTEERSVLREWRMQVEVKSIENKNMSEGLFEIPSDYKMFQKN